MIPIEGVLEKYGVDYNPDRDNNQQVHCPFHEDSRASASVNLGDGVFKCFGCDAAGNAVTLLMQYEGMTGREAERVAQELADGAGASVSRGAYSGGAFLPGNKRNQSGRRKWVSPWARK